MPVIQLPRDERWGDIGKALGAGVTQLVQAYQDKQVSDGVAQVMQDPKVSDADKPAAILKLHGQPGMIAYGKALETSQKSAQIKELLVRAGAESVQTQAEQAKLPYAAPEAAATVGLTQARTGAVGAEADRSRALLPGELTQQGAVTEGTRAGTSLKEAETDEKRLKTPSAVKQSQLETQLTEQGIRKATTEADFGELLLKQRKTLTDSGPTSRAIRDQMLDAAGVTDPGAREAANLEYEAHAFDKDPAKAADAFAKSISTYVNARSTAKTRAEAPSEAGTKEAGNAAEHATSMDRFLKSFKAGGAQRIGLFTGAPMKGYLEGKGISTGDPEVVEMMNAAVQQVASQAMGGGGGFGGEWKTRLAAKTTPSIIETPLHAIIAADQVADRMIARIQSRLLDHPAQKSLQDALAQWKNVKKTTGSYQSYDTAIDPKQPSQLSPVVLFDGDQVDAKTFKPLIEGKKDYDLGKNTKLLGADLIADARRRNMSPAARLEEVKKLYGGQ